MHLVKDAHRDWIRSLSLFNDVETLYSTADEGTNEAFSKQGHVLTVTISH
jgi:hypothetical protein